MADLVVKRDGSKEPYKKNKIKDSVENAAKDAGIDKVEIPDLIDAVFASLSDLLDQDEVSTDDIKENILSELDEIEPDVSDVWIEYDEERGKN